MFDLALTAAAKEAESSGRTSSGIGAEVEKEAREEFINWKTNTSLLYDFVASHVLEWPTVSVDWLPGLHSSAAAAESSVRSTSGPGKTPSEVELSSDEVRQSCLISTFTGGQEDNFLKVMDVVLPKADVHAEGRIYAAQGDYGGFVYGKTRKKFVIRTKIKMKHECNRAVHMPQTPSIAATIGPNGSANLVDLSGSGRVVADLKSHTSEGWGLAWNSCLPGALVTVADDKKLCLWDVAAPVAGVSGGTAASGSEAVSVVEPIATFSPHSAPPQDVTWKWKSESVFVTVGDDSMMYISDKRQAKPAQSVKAGEGAVNCVAWSADPEYLIATSGLDKEICLWDERSLRYTVHRMAGHDKSVCRVAFNPTRRHFLASGAVDKRVIVWDLRRIGVEQRADDVDDGPPELVFSHGGHTSAVNDFCWSGEESHPMLMVSCSDDNQLQVWTPNRELCGNNDPDGDEEVAEDDDEEDDFEYEGDDTTTTNSN